MRESIGMSFSLSSHLRSQKVQIPKTRIQIDNDKANILPQRLRQYPCGKFRFFRQGTRCGDRVELLWGTLLFFGFEHLVERGPDE